MTKRVEHIGDATLYLGDCRDVLPTLGRVDAVVTDPPYRGVKTDAWDNQWQTDEDFLIWADEICRSLKIIMADNGSLYWFCSSIMAARLEVTLSKHLRVINSLVWDKSGSRNGAAGSGVDVSALRSYWTANTERIVFAANDLGDAEASLIFGVYLRDQFARSGASNRQIQELFPSKTGGLTGCVSNWLLGLNIPTLSQYEIMSNFLKNASNGAVSLIDYAELRCQYDTVRRPMNLTAVGEWGDVWRFAIERAPKHPTQKPVSLMLHIVTASTRRYQTIIDPFMGSGTTGVACAKLGRRFTGIEIEPHYFDIACRRIDEATRQPDMFITRPPKPVQRPLFETAP